ncbi:hypothetical protein [Undibacterium aquatile]|uniref:Uncharacterized protein n=1 Tax=Undibacterium aquatile TaxID=1537398 RepID=A0ABR6XI91_9BURK|nr:hypothetical protein [Undibacterium aquatile]MBC3812483.1 hypothetical protein [Undibacterium aquatile]
MKQKQLSILAASLVAAFAANVASAGQIQSSSSAIAHEVIVNDAQAVSAPPVSYRFAGDIDATLVSQTFQIQLVLASGTFATAGNASAITLVDANGVGIPYTKYTVTTPTLSADKKVLYANVTFPQSAGTTFVTPAVRFNDTVTNTGVVVAPPGAGGPGSNGTAGVAATVSGLYTLVGAVQPCTNTIPTLGVAFKHFANVTSTAQADDVLNANAANEHQRSGSTNNGTLFTFPTNLSLGLTAASVNLARVDPSTGNTLFKGTAAASVLPALNGFRSTTVAQLGSITVKQDANGSDSGSNTVYAVASGVTFGANAATKTTGVVELKSYDIAITASQGFAVGSTVGLSTTADTYTAPASGAILSPAVTSTTGNTITFSNTTLTAAELAAPLYVFYTIPGTSVVPVSTFSATATLTKAAGTTTYLNEQNNSCTKPLAGLVGGVKVDVRNYATSKNQGWASYIRLINPSETNTATIYGQLIHSDGSYGGWGQITTLAPRAAANFSSTQIDALLTGTPVTNGTGYVAGAVAPVAQGLGERLRVTAEGVSALKVQNYLLNGSNGNFIEASSSQGVDFDSSTDRAYDSQLNDQDAQRGLAK